jgi:transcriptional regulator with XRE-family HTH domain
MSDKVSTVLGRVMASFRLFHDISQTDLSGALKMSQGRVSHMESGRNPPTVSQLLTFENLVRSKRKDVYTRSGFVMAVTSRVLEGLEAEKELPLEPLIARECAYLVASTPGSFTHHGHILFQLKRELDQAQVHVDFLHKALHVRADGRRAGDPSQLEKENE